MRSQTTHGMARKAEAYFALALCVAVFAAGVVGWLLPDRPSYAEAFAPVWLPLTAAGLATAGIVLGLRGRSRSPRLSRALSWGGVLLMLWTASGLPLDLLRVTSLVVPGLMPPGIDWPGLATRTLALFALVVLAHLAMTRSSAAASGRTAAASGRAVTPSGPAPWYGYAAVALALPYPILKTWWALGGDVGLRWPGAAGLDGSFALWLPAVPWLLAAALSLLLVATPRRMPRRLLLVAGWSATAIVATIGPAACWSLVTGLIRGNAEFGDMAGWVFGLFYGSWFLWAVAAGATTRSYQLRSAALRIPSPA